MMDISAIGPKELIKAATYLLQSLFYVQLHCKKHLFNPIHSIAPV